MRCRLSIATAGLTLRRPAHRRLAHAVPTTLVQRRPEGPPTLCLIRGRLHRHPPVGQPWEPTAEINFIEPVLLRALVPRPLLRSPRRRRLVNVSPCHHRTLWSMCVNRAVKFKRARCGPSRPRGCTETIVSMSRHLCVLVPPHPLVRPHPDARLRRLWHLCTRQLAMPSNLMTATILMWTLWMM
jgi:hypothetical protein